MQAGDYVVIAGAEPTKQPRLSATGRVERILSDATILVSRPIHIRGWYQGTYQCVLPSTHLRIDPDFFRLHQQAFASAGHPWAIA